MLAYRLPRVWFSRYCKCIRVVILISALFCFIFLICNKFSPKIPKTIESCNVTINVHQKVIAEVSDEFLSIGIDTLWIKRNRVQFTNTKLRKLAAELAPARLRIGGKMADRLIFNMYPNARISCKNPCAKYSKTICSAIKQTCAVPAMKYFVMSARSWTSINEFCRATKLRLMFSVNPLLRDEKGWDGQNAIELLRYSRRRYPNIDWQLGNEPNAFRHNYNISVTPQSLAQDFKKFRKFLNRYGYNQSLLIGPDASWSSNYLEKFLSSGSDYVNASSFHQYYLDSKTAVLEDFWNPDTMGLLETQLRDLRVRTFQYKHVPMWLTETGSSFGGGTLGLSDSFAGSPLWLDKLGLAAVYNLKTVVRHAFFGAAYTLVDRVSMDPLPDWWISVLHKKLVGKKVLRVSSTCSRFQRLYAHCANRRYTNDTTAVTIFAINLENAEANIYLNGTAFKEVFFIDEYIVTAPLNDRRSKTVLLNGKLLRFEYSMPILNPVISRNNRNISMPPYSMGFWVVRNTSIKVCD